MVASKLFLGFTWSEKARASKSAGEGRVRFVSHLRAHRPRPHLHNGAYTQRYTMPHIAEKKNESSLDELNVWRVVGKKKEPSTKKPEHEQPSLDYYPPPPCFHNSRHYLFYLGVEFLLVLCTFTLADIPSPVPLIPCPCPQRLSITHNFLPHTRKTRFVHCSPSRLLLLQAGKE